MFTGIVQALGTVQSMERFEGDMRFGISVSDKEFPKAELGGSIAVSGVCLTVIRWDQDCFFADVSKETLSLTTLGHKQTGDKVNLEPALGAGDPLGGHWVSGHVDGLVELTERWPQARSEVMKFQMPEKLARFVASKGSVCLDGVSLTVNQVESREFEVNIVPHTLANTTFSALNPGDRLNLEVDMLARYVDRLLEYSSSNERQ